jgi:dipeptidyl aminopeptidase/acylaminoacyl peptidase
VAWGGAARPLTNRPEGVDNYCWSPDSARIVFAARDPSNQETEYLKSIRDKKSPGPLVLTRVQHKTDEEGYLDTVPTHLFVLDVATGQIEQLTEGSASESHPVWSPDGAWILFRSNRTGDMDNNRRFDLWLISPATKEVRRLTWGDVDAQGAAFSPDGTEVAYMAAREPENNYLANRLWTIPVQAAEPDPRFPENLGHGWQSIGGVVPDVVVGDPAGHARVYPVPERSTPAHLASQNFDGFIQGPLRYDGPDHILALAADRAQVKLFRLGIRDDSYSVLYPQKPSGTVTAFDSQSQHLVAVVNCPDTGPECLALINGGVIRLSQASSTWLSRRTTVAFQRIQYLDHDGQEIEALVLAPPDFSPSRPVPLLVSIHGGPMDHEAPEFEFETQYWANRGYMVLLVNYRGSTSYGEAFCETLRGHWGPREHDDIMCGIDTLIEKGWVDPTRLYCTGFSMGGIMTNWAVGHTDRFRAAVTEHGVWDYVSAFGTDDCHLWWQDDFGLPWQNRALYEQCSPMSGLPEIRTPMLITAGEHDWRCPLSQAEQLYMGLKKRGVDTELVIYPGEHHSSRTRPARAIDRLSRIDEWFARYGGIPVQAGNRGDIVE